MLIRANTIIAKSPIFRYFKKEKDGIFLHRKQLKYLPLIPQHYNLTLFISS